MAKTENRLTLQTTEGSPEERKRERARARERARDTSEHRKKMKMKKKKKKDFPRAQSFLYPLRLREAPSKIRSCYARAAYLTFPGVYGRRGWFDTH